MGDSSSTNKNQDDGGNRLLQMVIKGNIPKVTKLLEEGANVHHVAKKSGLTPFLRACQLGHLEMAMLLK